MILSSKAFNCCNRCPDMRSLSHSDKPDVKLSVRNENNPNNELDIRIWSLRSIYINARIIWWDNATWMTTGVLRCNWGLYLWTNCDLTAILLSFSVRLITMYGHKISRLYACVIYHLNLPFNGLMPAKWTKYSTFLIVL